MVGPNAGQLRQRHRCGVWCWPDGLLGDEVHHIGDGGDRVLRAPFSGKPQRSQAGMGHDTSA